MLRCAYFSWSPLLFPRLLCGLILFILCKFASSILLSILIPTSLAYAIFQIARVAISRPGECSVVVKITIILKTCPLPEFPLCHSRPSWRAAGRRAPNAQIDSNNYFKEAYVRLTS